LQYTDNSESAAHFFCIVSEKGAWKMLVRIIVHECSRRHSTHVLVALNNEAFGHANAHGMRAGFAYPNDQKPLNTSEFFFGLCMLNIFY